MRPVLPPSVKPAGRATMTGRRRHNGRSPPPLQSGDGLRLGQCLGALSASEAPVRYGPGGRPNISPRAGGISCQAADTHLGPQVFRACKGSPARAGGGRCRPDLSRPLLCLAGYTLVPRVMANPSSAADAFIRVSTIHAPIYADAGGRCQLDLFRPCAGWPSPRC